MKRLIILLAVIGISATTLTAQSDNRTEKESVSMTYIQVDDVRHKLGLDHNQFDKVYKAYEKYNKAVFGSSETHRQGPRAGGMGRHGGPGRPDGSEREIGRGRPPMDPSGMGMPPSGQTPPKSDPAKMEKKMAKQEEKLRKSIKKILKTEELYEKWLDIRKDQLSIPKKGHWTIDRK